VTRAAPTCHRGAPAWVVPRWSGDSHSLVGERAPPNGTRSCARGAADPAPRPSDCGRSRRRATNGASARRRHAGHLSFARRYPLPQLRRSALVALSVGLLPRAVINRASSGWQRAVACVKVAYETFTIYAHYGRPASQRALAVVGRNPRMDPRTASAAL
jgi:hypothetical protein